MSPLIPCSSCRRHVKRAELACPFCATPLSNSLLELPAGRSMPPGTKRAALFAMGVSFAASACEPERADVPIYGAPSAPLAGSSGAGGGGSGAGGGNAGASSGTGGGNAGGGNAGTGGSGVPQDAPDATADAAPDADVIDAGASDPAP